MNKEKSHLITQSLISSIDWYRNAPETLVSPEKGGDGNFTWKDKAFSDLSCMLNRVKTPLSEDAMNGIVFEKTVYKKSDLKDPGGSEFFKEVCEEVRGFSFYKKEGISFFVDNVDCYLYAKYDAIKLPVLKDIKTTKSYTRNKYLKSFQHKLYCFISGAYKFEYVVVEWDTYPKIKAVHKEWFFVEDREVLKQEVEETIFNALNTLKVLDLWESYRNNYCLY